VKIAFFVAWVAFLIVLCPSARAETWEAPIGGQPLALGDSRVACPGSAGGWVIEQEGHAVRPPARDDAIGTSVDVKVAPALAGCAASAATLTLVATGRWPVIDPAATTLFVDDARVELVGHALRGLRIEWQLGDRAGSDRCLQPQADPAGERCVVSVARGLPADPNADDLRWAPAGSRAGAGVTLFDADGRPAPAEDRVVRPARVVLSSLVAPDVSIDLAGGTASRIPLLHPEAVTGADCGAVSCDVAGNAIIVGGLSSISSALAVRLRLAPRVVVRRGDGFDPAPVVSVAVLPCAMSIASGEAVRSVDATRVVVRVDARCAAEARDLRWFSSGRALELLETVQDAGTTYALLAVGRIEGDELVVTAVHGGAEGSTVGQARIHTRAVPLPHSTLALDDDNIDFVPTNRPALARWARTQGVGELVVIPVDGVYEVTVRQGGTLIQGEPGAGGVVALRFAWRVPTLPASLAGADLAVISDPVQRPLHEAAMAVPLTGKSSMVDLFCGPDPRPLAIAPGTNAHVEFELRDACRLVFHRERLTRAEGAQRLQLDVEVTGVDGASRPEAHVSQPLILRVRDQPRVVWLKGISRPFDRATIRISRGDAVSDDGARDEPSVQWAVVFGTAHFRLYATTAVPTGLYRVSDGKHSGILSLNLAVIMRATWLDPDGREGVVGVEGGVLAEGLANDVDADGHSLTQVATVTGIGLSVPIANRSLATETSINLHAWFEYEISRQLGGEPGSPLGFVFGPSLSIGNIGTNL
jgi:hypothetical protein